MNSARRAGLRVSGGFTLLELLVGLSVLTLIAWGAYAGLRAGASTWERTDERQAASTEMRLALDYLRRELGGTFPLAVVVDNRWRVWFDGEGERLAFVAEGPAHLGLNGLFQYTLAVERHAARADLSLTLERLDERLRIGQVGERAVRRVLIEGVQHVRLSYFGSFDKRAPPEWRSQWREAQRLPQLIRLELASTRAGAWPDLIVRVPVDGLRFRRVSRSRAAASDDEAIDDEQIQPEDFDDGGPEDGGDDV